MIELEGYTTQRLAEQVGWDKIVSGYGLSGHQMKLQRKEQSKEKSKEHNKKQIKTQP